MENALHSVVNRSGFIGLLLKLVVYGLVTLGAVAAIYPTALDDPAAAIADAEMAAEAVGDVTNAPPADQINEQTIEQRIHAQVNHVRQERGLSQLQYDTALVAIARDHSNDMAERGYFSHYSPEGEDFSDRYDAAGYTCRVEHEDKIHRGGENLALTYMYRPVKMQGRQEQYSNADELAAGVVRGWLNSPDHRENLLREAWEQEGIGVHITDDYQVFVTQNFC